MVYMAPDRDHAINSLSFTRIFTFHCSSRVVTQSLVSRFDISLVCYLSFTRLLTRLLLLRLLLASLVSLHRLHQSRDAFYSSTRSWCTRACPCWTPRVRTASTSSAPTSCSAAPPRCATRSQIDAPTRCSGKLRPWLRTERSRSPSRSSRER
jgi:hypothetical protein